LFVPEEVFDELGRQDDDLHGWVSERTTTLVVPTSRPVLLAVRSILHDHPKLTMTGTGRGKADPFVIAEAQRRGCPVVTEEGRQRAEAPDSVRLRDAWSLQHRDARPDPSRALDLPLTL
jgi:hypothetical protein